MKRLTRRAVESEIATMDSAFCMVAEAASARLRAMAAAALRQHARLHEFAAHMGVCCFYDSRQRPIEDSDVPAAARAVIAYGNRLTEWYGSPGIVVTRDLA